MNQGLQAYHLGKLAGRNQGKIKFEYPTNKVNFYPGIKKGYIVVFLKSADGKELIGMKSNVGKEQEGYTQGKRSLIVGSYQPIVGLPYLGTKFI